MMWRWSLARRFSIIVSKLLCLWVFVHFVYKLHSVTWLFCQRCWWTHEDIRWFQFSDTLLWCRNDYLILASHVFLFDVHLCIWSRCCLLLRIKRTGLNELWCLYLTWCNHLIFLLLHPHGHASTTLTWNIISTLNLNIHALTLTDGFGHVSSSVEVYVICIHRYIFHLLLLRIILLHLRLIFCPILPKLIFWFILAGLLSVQVIVILDAIFWVIIVSTVIHSWCLVKLLIWLSFLALWWLPAYRWWFRMCTLRYRFWCVVLLLITQAVRNVLIIILILLLCIIKLIRSWLLFKFLNRLTYKALFRSQIWFSRFHCTLFWAFVWKLAVTSYV